ncbi:MAG: hypothetical protein GC134_00620 [Proteobacteria bacterium]|nr:hypothetical protein [Pseudomonadota bacterium]
MNWVYFSLLQVFLSAGMAESNRRLQLDGVRLNFWRTLLLSGLFSIPACYVPWPHANGFYVAALFSGVASAVASIAIFTMSARFNGRVALLQVPITTLMTFLAWLPFDTRFPVMVQQAPLQVAAIAACLLCASLCMVAMQRHSIGADTLRIIVPVSMLATASGIAGKLAISHEGTLTDSIVVISFLVMVTQTLFSGALMLRTARHHAREATPYPLFPPKMHKGMVIMAFWGGSGCYVSWLAIGLAPNPGYANAVFLLTPVLMLFYHKAIGIKDDASPLAGTVLTLAIIALVILSAS